MKMQTEPSVIDVPLIVLRAADDRIEGKTVLQKLSYFLAVRTGLQLGFAPHFYGPFSRQLEGAVDTLTFSGILSESTVQHGVNASGWPVRETTYELTPEGTEFADLVFDKHAGLASECRELVAALKKWDPSLNQKPLSLAAKVHFLSKGEKLSPEAFRRAAREVGWELDDAEVESALALLSQLDL